MEFEVLYQELVGGVDVIRALVAGVTAEEARPRPARNCIKARVRSFYPKRNLLK
jgi:hypothetical protein